MTDFSAGFFYGRYLACGYISGDLVCLPLGLAEDFPNLDSFLSGKRLVTSFSGLCVDDPGLAAELRTRWGTSFSDKTIPDSATSLEFRRGLLVGFSSRAKEPLLLGMADRLC